MEYRQLCYQSWIGEKWGIYTVGYLSELIGVNRLILRSDLRIITAKNVQRRAIAGVRNTISHQLSDVILVMSPSESWLPPPPDIVHTSLYKGNVMDF